MCFCSPAKKSTSLPPAAEPPLTRPHLRAELATFFLCASQALGDIDRDERQQDHQTAGSAGYKRSAPHHREIPGVTVDSTVERAQETGLRQSRVQDTGTQRENVT